MTPKHAQKLIASARRRLASKKARDFAGPSSSSVSEKPNPSAEVPIKSQVESQLMYLVQELGSESTAHAVLSSAFGILDKACKPNLVPADSAVLPGLMALSVALSATQDLEHVRQSYHVWIGGDAQSKALVRAAEAAWLNAIPFREEASLILDKGSKQPK